MRPILTALICWSLIACASTGAAGAFTDPTAQLPAGTQERARVVGRDVLTEFRLPGGKARIIRIVPGSGPPLICSTTMAMTASTVTWAKSMGTMHPR